MDSSGRPCTLRGLIENGVMVRSQPSAVSPRSYATYEQQRRDAKQGLRVWARLKRLSVASERQNSSSDESSGAEEESSAVVYRVQTVTSHTHAAGDVAVRIVLHGSCATSRKLRLRASRRVRSGTDLPAHGTPAPFRRGSVDTFHVNSGWVGEIVSVEVLVAQSAQPQAREHARAKARASKWELHELSVDDPVGYSQDVRVAGASTRARVRYVCTCSRVIDGAWTLPVTSRVPLLEYSLLLRTVDDNEGRLPQCWPCVRVAYLFLWRMDAKGDGGRWTAPSRPCVDGELCS